MRIEFLVYALVTVAVLAAYARWGARFVKESAAGRVGTGMLLAMLGFALLWLTLLRPASSISGGSGATT